MTDVTIIGAGIVGVTTAIHLQREGHRVTVVDRSAPGQAASAPGRADSMHGGAASYGNAGSLAPSSIIPMAMPGTIRQVPKWITNPLGPLTLSWRELPSLLPWFLHFRRACELEQVHRGARALRSLNRSSVHAYRTLLASAGAPDLVRHEGMLHVYRTEAAFAGTAFARKLREENEGLVEVLDAEAIRRMEPSLSPDCRFGFFLPDNGHVTNPGRVVETLAADFQRNGGMILRAAVDGFRLDGGAPTALLTDQGAIPVDRVVIAAGAWSRPLAAKLGSRIPIAPERGYHIEIPQPRVDLKRPVTDGEGRFVATPMEGGLRIAGTSEFRNADAPPNWQRTDALAALAPRLLPGLNVEGHRRWMGTRPSMPDSLPVLGRSERHERVYFAFGHGHWGLMAAPATGQAIADLIAGREPQIDLAPFRPDRF